MFHFKPRFRPRARRWVPPRGTRSSGRLAGSRAAKVCSQATCPAWQALCYRLSYPLRGGVPIASKHEPLHAQLP
jgi:hypothetical protein